MQIFRLIGYVTFLSQNEHSKKCETTSFSNVVIIHLAYYKYTYMWVHKNEILWFDRWL